LVDCPALGLRRDARCRYGVEVRPGTALVIVLLVVLIVVAAFIQLVILHPG
jgi:hypothetical protein